MANPCSSSTKTVKFARLIVRSSNKVYYRTFCDPNDFLKLRESRCELKCRNCEIALVKYKKNTVFNYRTFCIHHGESLDTFTENLVQEKGIKWSSVFIRIPDKYKNRLSATCLEKPGVNIINDVSPLKSLDINQIVKFFRESVNTSNIKLISSTLETCRAQNLILPSDVLNDIAALFAVHGYIDGISLVQSLCESSNPAEFKLRAQYMHYLAEAMWIQGNIQESLKMFDQVYSECLHKRSKVKVMLRHLFIHVIKNHGEASLVNIINFVKNFSEKYCDFSLMAFLWKELFESEWFSDQQLAAELQSKHRELTASISGMIPVMAKQLLTHHKLETFHRLIEVTLCNNITKQTQFLLQLLFEYKYAIDDLQACSHIMETSVALDIPLKEDQCSRFIELLLHRKKQLPICDVKKPTPFTFKF